MSPDTHARVFYVGSLAPPSQLLADLGCRMEPGWPTDPAAGDTIFIETVQSEGVPHGNAFSAVREVKQIAGVRVFVLAPADDSSAPQIARYCQADGCFALLGDRFVADRPELMSLIEGRRHASVDQLLEHYERRLGDDEGKRTVGLQRLLNASSGGSVISQLTDPETGLYEGAFASFKIDEELKRANRLNHPLTLILLDIGIATPSLPNDPKERRLLFAEVASVFLNTSRDIDVLARFTPTTFLFLLPGTGHEGGSIAARRMIDGLRQKSPIGGLELVPRAGLVTTPCGGDRASPITSRDTFLLKAEACLQKARGQVGGYGVCASSE